MRKELFVGAKITRVVTLEAGEIRTIQLTLPKELKVKDLSYPVRDRMRPGTAFLTKSFGERTQKLRRRMYTRSNTSTGEELQLETVINYTHSPKADTSLWWQSDDVIVRQRSGEPIEVRVDWNEADSTFQVYENSHVCNATNLRLEPDGEWERMKFVGIAFATGITPFLSYLRYMQARQFGRDHDSVGAHFTLITSARTERHLIAHEELLELKRHFPMNFHYHPVLTREWPPDWPYTKGRIIRVKANGVPSGLVDLSQLLDVVPELDQCHLRMCGNQEARDQLERGIVQSGLSPLSFRTEVW